MALAVTYSLVTPPFEAGDESRHYAVIKYMADTGRLIDQTAPDIQHLQHHWSHEGNQPPLYYALAATLTFWIDTGSWDDVFWYNPHTTIGNPLRPDNKNISIHPPGEAWPWRGHVLAVHLIRFLSIAMAAMTVAACYAIALTLFKGNRLLAAGAMAVTAFNPMFIFISASINNDNAVIMFVTLAIYQLIIINEQLTIPKGHNVSNTQRALPEQSQFTRSPFVLPHSSLVTPHSSPLRITRHSSLLTRHSPLLLGLLIGLGALSKLYAIGLLPLAGVLFIWLAYRQLTIKNEQSAINEQRLHTPHSSPLTYHASRIFRTTLPWIATMTFVFLAIAGWFYLRNALLYNGDALALQIMRDTAGQRQELPSLATIRAEFEGFRIAYWALFGGVNILADRWIYTLLDFVSLIAVIGVITFIGFTIYDLQFTIYNLRHHTLNPKSKIQNLKSKIHLPTFTLLVAWLLIMLAGFIVWNLTQPAGQGRLFYPAIAAISALGMLGLTWWLPSLGQKIIAVLVMIGLFLFALISPFLYIAPAYAKPPILTQADLPAGLQPVNYTYDDAIQLIGYRLHTETVRPAQTLPITLYWKLLKPVELNYSIFIHLLGRDRQVIGQLDTYPGGGRRPTSLLSPGDIVADTYEVPIAPETEFTHAPTRLRVLAGIYDYFEPGRPGRPVVSAAGKSVEPVVAAVKLVPWQWPEISPSNAPVNFFDKATLLSHHLADDRQSITFNWQADSHFEADYTVFIQAWNIETGQYVTGFDGPPVQGDYPTSLWEPGEIIVDRHQLDLTSLPPGVYNILAGLYNPATGERLPAFDPTGPLPDYAVLTGQITISETGANK